MKFCSCCSANNRSESSSKSWNMSHGCCFFPMNLKGEPWMWERNACWMRQGFITVHHAHTFYLFLTICCEMSARQSCTLIANTVDSFPKMLNNYLPSEIATAPTFSHDYTHLTTKWWWGFSVYSVCVGFDSGMCSIHFDFWVHLCTPSRLSVLSPLLTDRLLDRVG